MHPKTVFPYLNLKMQETAQLTKPTMVLDPMIYLA
jgi:hypothetical protein